MIYHQNNLIDSFNARFLLQKISLIEHLIEKNKNNITTHAGKMPHTLNKNVDLQNKILSDSIIEIKFPEIIKFSTNFKYFLNNDKITIMDENLNKYIFLSIDIQNKSVNLIEEFKFSNLNIDSILEIGCINKKMFKITEDFLVEFGKGKPKVEFVCHNDDKIVSVFSLGCPFIGSLGDTTVSSKFFCRVKNLKNKKEEIYCIEKDGITNRQFLDSAYYLSIIFVIPYDDYILIPPFSTSKTKKSFHLRYDFDRKNKLLVYRGCSENLNSKISDPNFTFELKNKEYIYKISNDNFQFLIKYPVVYEIKSKKYHVFKCNELIEKLKAGDVIFDMAYSKEKPFWNMLMYSNKDDKYFICSFDPVNDKINSIKILPYSGKDWKFGFPKFCAQNYIISMDNKSIYFFKIGNN